MVQTLQPQGLAILCLSISLSTFTVLLRLYSRWLGKAYGYDDALIIAALICAIIHSGLSYVYVQLIYVGYHTKDIPYKLFTVDYQLFYLRINLVRIVFYALIFAFARASAIVFLLRLEEYRENIRRWLKVLLVVNFLNAISLILSDLFACSPIHFLWDSPKMMHFENGKWIPEGKCLNFEALGSASTCITILLDILVLITPMAMVWKLRMSKSSKIVTVMVLSVGWLATITSVGQLIVYINTFHTNPANDGGYNIGWTLAHVEVNMAIIAASVPALKALYKRISPSSSDEPSSPELHGSVGSLHDFPSWDPTGAIRDDISGRRQRRPSRPNIQRDSIYDDVNFLDERKSPEFDCKREEACESSERIVGMAITVDGRHRVSRSELELGRVGATSPMRSMSPVSPTSPTSMKIGDMV